MHFHCHVFGELESPMAFRKRNIPLNKPPTAPSTSASNPPAQAPPGTRPSFLTSHPTTSIGSPSLDGLLGGHGGLVLGSSLLVEESGTTDFAGAVCKYFAAEGVCQGHVVHLVGVGEGWVGNLPGVAEGRSGKERGGESVAGGEGGEETGKMKIAWRYERLGQAGERGAWHLLPFAMYFASIAKSHVSVLSLTLADGRSSAPRSLQSHSHSRRRAAGDTLLPHL